MENKSPAFQFYPKDFLTDDKVCLMSCEVRGIYIILLCHDWLSDGIPAQPSAWFTLAGNGEPSDPETAITQLSACFKPHPKKTGVLTNPRLLRERVGQAKFKKERSEAGKRGMAKRWKSKHFDNSAITEPITKHNSSSSSSSSPSLKPTTSGRKRPVLFDNTFFDQFWAAYPRHEKKQDALKAWKRLDPDEELFKRILKAVAEQKKTDSWKRGYVPHPTTWVNGKRWEDELTALEREVGVEEVNSHIPSAAESKKMLEELMS